MSDSILEVKNLSVEFRGTEVVHDVSFHIERGETVAIVGESGSGKSLLPCLSCSCCLINMPLIQLARFS